MPTSSAVFLGASIGVIVLVATMVYGDWKRRWEEWREPHERKRAERIGLEHMTLVHIRLKVSDWIGSVRLSHDTTMPLDLIVQMKRRLAADEERAFLFGSNWREEAESQVTGEPLPDSVIHRVPLVDPAYAAVHHRPGHPGERV